MGRLLFQVTGAFAEFERSMIRQRVQAGLDGIKAKVAKDGKFVTKAGIVRSRLGRPGAAPEALEQARQMLAEGKGIINTAKLCKLGTSTVQKAEAGDAGGLKTALSVLSVVRPPGLLGFVEPVTAKRPPYRAIYPRG